jgi:hypothetical protein
MAAMVGELKDIELVATAVRQADNRNAIGCGWRMAVTGLNGIRRWMFLPTMLLIVPGLVLLQGGASTTQVCQKFEHLHANPSTLGVLPDSIMIRLGSYCARVTCGVVLDR